MKLYLLFFLFLFLPIAFAQENIIFSKSSYLSGETAQIEIYLPDSIKTLTQDNFAIVDENYQQTNIGFIFNEISLNHYFIYFDTPKNTEGAFNLRITNYLHRENSQLKEETIYKKFNIINSSLPIISIKPALILFYPNQMNPFFNIKLKSINKDSDVFIAAQDNFIIPSINNLFLPEASIKYFSIEIDSSNLTNLTASSLLLTYNANSYVIPIWIFKEQTLKTQDIASIENITKNITSSNITQINNTLENITSSNITQINNTLENTSQTEIKPVENLANIIIFQNITSIKNIIINKTIKKSKELSFFVYAENKTKIFSISIIDIPEKQTLEGELGFKNTADKILHNIKITLTDNLLQISKLNQSHFLTVDINETKNILLIVNEQKKPRLSNYSGNIILSSLENYKASLPLELKINKTKPMQEQLFEEKQIESSYIPESSISSQLPFNFTQAPEEKQKTNYLPAILLILFIFVLLIIYLLNKKRTAKISFDEYLKKIKK